MLPAISLIKRATAGETLVLVINTINDIPRELFTGPELTFLRKRLKEKDKNIVTINRLDNWLFVVRVEKGKSTPRKIEKLRKAGDGFLPMLNDSKIESVTLLDIAAKPAETLAIAEGMALGNYKFLKYVKEASTKEPSLKAIGIVSKHVKNEQVERMNFLCDAVYRCRSLVNEPVLSLNAEKMAQEFEQLGAESGVKVEVMNKNRIEALRMGGLLAVNRGSIDPPTFTIMEYKPEKPVNKKPLVFVGKGVVYDTGGLSLKPSASMDTMKCDMAGAAAVAAALFAIAKSKLPLHVVALVPATDNRPDGNATTPGDIISMMDGTTVEVMNTDAEGRLVLCDAMTYTERFEPEVVVDIATLTGACVIALGHHATGLYGNSDSLVKELANAGDEAFDRAWPMPLWDDYQEQLKSNFADMANIGGRAGGSVTAACFLSRFAKKFDWAHLDIAGTAWVSGKEKGATGRPVPMLTHFLMQRCEK